MRPSMTGTYITSSSSTCQNSRGFPASPVASLCFPSSMLYSLPSVSCAPRIFLQLRILSPLLTAPVLTG